MSDPRSIERRLRDLERMVSRLIQVGTVTDVDYPAKRVKVEIGDRESYWLRFSTTRAGADRSWWPPTVGEQVMVYAPNGDAVAAVVGDSLYQQDHDAPADQGTIRRTTYGNGTVVELDKSSGLLRVQHPGKLQVQADGDIEITAGGNVTITGQRIDLNP